MNIFFLPASKKKKKLTKPHSHHFFFLFVKLKRSNFYFIKIAALGELCVEIIGNVVKWWNVEYVDGKRNEK